MKQLKRIIYNYRTHVPRHRTNSAIFNTVAMHLSSLLVQHAPQDPSWRFFFCLCLDYWRNAAVCFRVVAAFVPAHLALALQAGAITVAEARRLDKEFGGGWRRHAGGEEVLSDAYMDFDRAIRGQSGATVQELVGRFAELMSLENRTQQFVEMEGRQSDGVGLNRQGV